MQSTTTFFFGLVLALLLSQGASYAQTTTIWQNAGSDWGTAANWSAGVPDTSTEVAILPGSASPVSPNMAAAFNVHSLLITNTLGSYNITQTGTQELILNNPAGIKLTGGASTIEPDGRIQATGSATFELNGGSLSFANNFKLGPNNAGSLRTLFVNGTGNLTFNTLLQVGTGSSQAHGITLTNYSGTVRVTGTNNITGQIRVFGGTFLMNGYQAPAGTANVQYYNIFGGTLGGTGVVSATGTGLANNPNGVRLRNDGLGTTAILNPGDPNINGGIGALTINGNLVFENQSATPAFNPTAVFSLSSTAAFDQVFVNGTVNLNTNNSVTGRARLQLQLASNFTGGDVGVFLPLIVNDGTDPILNLFSADGTSATAITNNHTFSFTSTTGEQYVFRYLYDGGTGNDFGLLIDAYVIPEPSTVATVALGMGLLALARRFRRC
jgi:hypothetical protein